MEEKKDLAYNPLIMGDLSDLHTQPKTHQGNIILLEVRGGVDKGLTPETKSIRKGHRPDTIPICNEIIKLGWGSFPIFYSDETYDLVKEYLTNNQVIGIIVRINPGIVPGVTREKWEKLVTHLSKIGIEVMSTPQVMKQMGSKDVLYKIRNLNCGLKDTEVYYSIEEWETKFPSSLTKKRVVKQNRGSSGEGIWVVELQDKTKQITKDSVLELQEAVDNHRETKTLGEFLNFCHKYLEGIGGQIVNQQFCPRIIEGEIRLNMIFDKVEAIVHKKPVGGFSSTISSGAIYTEYPPNHPKFSKLLEKWELDKPRIMETLGLKGSPLPLIWTADFIKDDSEDSYIVGEFNCSCVGISKQLKIMAPKVAEAAIRCICSIKE